MLRSYAVPTVVTRVRRGGGAVKEACWRQSTVMACWCLIASAAMFRLDESAAIAVIVLTGHVEDVSRIM